MLLPATASKSCVQCGECTCASWYNAILKGWKSFSQTSENSVNSFFDNYSPLTRARVQGTDRCNQRFDTRRFCPAQAGKVFGFIIRFRFCQSAMIRIHLKASARTAALNPSLCGSSGPQSLAQRQYLMEHLANSKRFDA